METYKSLVNNLTEVVEHIIHEEDFIRVKKSTIFIVIFQPKEGSPTNFI